MVEDLISQLRGRYTIVIVTHNLAQARRLADRLAVFWMENGSGNVIEQGAAAQVFAAPSNEIAAAYLQGARG